MFADEALTRLIQHYSFKTVLDIGSGAGDQAKTFTAAGKCVTAIDLGVSCYFDSTNYTGVRLLRGRFEDVVVEPHDCVWASHILEHQPDVRAFLTRCYQLTNKVFAVTVPPLKHEIVGGHVSLWNAGLLLYNLILAGFDCSQAAIKEYGYNISVIVEKCSVPESVLRSLHSDKGDIERLKAYFPISVSERFCGQNINVNW